VLDLVSTGLLAGAAAIMSWLVQAYRFRNEHVATVSKHRDDLTLELLGGARAEMAAAKVEVATLRAEVKGLRSLELHFYLFQQALDHLEAILTAETVEQRAVAENNARAFLDRIKRKQQEERENSNGMGV